MPRSQPTRLPMMRRPAALLPILLLALLLPALGGCDILYGFAQDIGLIPKDDSGDHGTASCNTAGVLSSDPLTEFQWHLQNTGQTAFADVAGTSGQDICAVPVYNDGYSGSGVVIAVVDSGLEIAHEDLSGNVVAGLSHNFLTGGTDPTNTSATSGDHGTSVGGLSAATWGNGVGGQGVAPQAGLVGYNLLANFSDANQVLSLGGASYSAGVEVFNQSYGFSNNSPITINTTVRAQLVDGITNKREGKGAIYVKSAGNGFIGFGTADCTYAKQAGLSCQNTNMDPQNAEPYNITVAALDAGGVRSSYSTAGAGVWISAPGGEYGYNSNYVSYSNPVAGEPAMVTTDQSGCSKGYSPNYNFNALQSGHPDNANCDYTSTFNGTSSAAPVLSGVVALMLEANPNLTWRDVKHILASTARQVDASIAAVTLPFTTGTYTARDAWITNAAGYKFHNWYGFGAVNAQAAVSAALNYSANSWAAQTTKSADSGLITLTIPDSNATGITGTLLISSGFTFTEAVQIKVWSDHTNIGELGLELSSPNTKSILLTVNNGFEGANSLGSGMVLLSNAFYGENPTGTWTLRAIDSSDDTGHGSGNITQWTITVYGH